MPRREDQDCADQNLRKKQPRCLDGPSFARDLVNTHHIRDRNGIEVDDVGQAKAAVVQMLRNSDRKMRLRLRIGQAGR
jgi:hypothetical protein